MTNGHETTMDASAGTTPRSKVRRPERRGIGRPRLVQALTELWERRIGIVVAPAGSGKSTLLAQFSSSVPGAVAWYQADTSDYMPRTLLAGLTDAVAHALGSPLDPWLSVEDAIEVLDALEHFSASRLLIVIDDLHTIHATGAEAELERLISYLPHHVHILIGSRRMPSMNLTRMRVGDELVEVIADDLRFRAWEVEALFRDFYGSPLPPEEMARLARTTEGWAAGLQLFHLATRGRSGGDRRRVLERLGTDSNLVREYLTRNVLHELDREVRAFLLQTCVLGRLSAAICDRFLATSGTAALLEELERLQLFTQSLDDGAYHYHEVLRSHLEAMLLEQIGPLALRERYLLAGAALEECGAAAEALRAYVCAEDQTSVARILGRSGEEISGHLHAWTDLLPSPLLEHDPWVQLSHARRLVREGRPHDAADLYRRAHDTFETAEGRAICRRELEALLAWTADEPGPLDPAEWTSVVRRATRTDPASVRPLCRSFPGVTGLLCEGLVAALDGHAHDAISLLRAAFDRGELSPVQSAVAAAVYSVVDLIADSSHGQDSTITAHLRVGDIDWLDRFQRAALNAYADNRDVVRQAQEAADQWSVFAARFFAGLVAAYDQAADGTRLQAAGALLATAAEDAASLAAPVLEGWALATRAVVLARLGDGRAPDVARAVLRAAGHATAGWAVATAFRVLAVSSEDVTEKARLSERASTMAEELGVRLPAVREEVGAHGEGLLALGAGAVEAVTRAGVSVSGSINGMVEVFGSKVASAPADGSIVDVVSTTQPARGATRGSAESEPSVAERLGNSPIGIRCLGTFELWTSGQLVDLTPLKPRFRTVLRLLASRAGTMVHKLDLALSLWPDADEAAAIRNVNVALSAVRQAIEPGQRRGASTVILREGEAYGIAVTDDIVVDHSEFAKQVARGRQAQSQQDVGAAVHHFERAMSWYAGDLLPSEGAAEWVLKDRERLRLEAASTSLHLGELLLAMGSPRDAASAAERGLQIDRYRDGLWKVLIAALEADDRRAEAERCRRRYDEALAELGIEAPHR